MATNRITVFQSVGAAGAVARTRSQAMTILEESGVPVLVVPFAPRQVDHGSIGDEWASVARPLRAPILSRSAEKLETMGLSLFLGHQDPEQTVEGLINALRTVSVSRKRLVISYGPSEAGNWRLTDFSYVTVDRHPDTQEVTRCDASLTFTRVSDLGQKVGPISGGHEGGGKGGSRYTVKKGDTLHKISNEVYGTPKHWRLIADANKIRDPKKDAKLKVGKILKIPAKPKK